MKVITVAARKGGQGKSALCRNLSVAALKDRLRTACIDADEQATLVHWQKRRPHSAPSVLALGALSIPAALEELQGRGADLVFIDLPPFSLPLINAAIAQSDFCVIVTEPLVEALEQVGTTVRIVQALKKPAGIIINKAPSRAAALNLARTALSAFELPICPQQLTNLIVHSYSAASGQVPSEAEPQGKAASEIAIVWKWLKEIMHDGTSAVSLPVTGRSETETRPRARARTAG